MTKSIDKNAKKYTGRYISTDYLIELLISVKIKRNP